MTKRITQKNAWPLAVLLVVGIGSCTIAFDLSSMKEGCLAENHEKRCNGRCVPDNDPATGCGVPDDCAPCAFSRGTVKCNLDGQCERATCWESWVDCDEDASNGCETNIRTDAKNCRGCGELACKDALPPNVAEAGCLGDEQEPDTCGIAQCQSGFGDCNSDPRDGCEVNLSNTAANCRECGRACDAGYDCVDGGCSPTATQTALPDAG